MTQVTTTQIREKLEKNKSVSTKDAPEIVGDPYQGIDIENLSDIDLNMEYSDDEDRNYFDSDKALINHLFNIEESNLFKIKHLEDSEQTLERIKEQSKCKIEAAQAEIDELDQSIKE